MAAKPTVEMRSVGRWPGRCRGRMAAIVRVLCTVLYSTGTVGDKPNWCKRGYGIARHSSDTTGPGHQQLELISSAVLFLLRDSMSSRRCLVAAVTQV